MSTVLNPATEEPLAELEAAGVEETDAAVARAKAAYPAWRAVTPADRGRLLRRLGPPVGGEDEGVVRLASGRGTRVCRGSSGEPGASRSRVHAARSGWSRRSSISTRARWTSTTA